ncbi:hypothetical protein IVA80_15375 [Bradyrhizobium sp. 139]|nr:hypothetical protein [Bradyrhizobium sp. 139]
MTWAEWFANFDNRKIADDQINETTSVSTVFLGLDHSFSPGADPLLFETMVFGGPLNYTTRRYATYTEAERGHAEAVAEARIAAAKVKAIADAAGANKFSRDTHR